MINELSSVLITIISTLFTTGSVFSFVYHKQTKREKALQNLLKEADVERAKISAKNDTWHLYEEQLDKANQRIKDLLEINADKETRYSDRLSEMGKRYSDRINEVEERFNKQTTFLRGVQRELNQVYSEKNELTAKIGKQQRVIDHLRQWLCQRPWKDCQRRKPQQVVKPTKYVPLEEYEAETVALLQETLSMERHEQECECEGCHMAECKEEAQS